MIEILLKLARIAHCLVVLSASAAAQVYVHDSPVAADMLTAIDRRVQDGEWTDAARLADSVIESHRGSLLEREPGLYGDAGLVAERRILEEPRLLAAYQSRFEPAAGRELAQAGHDAQALRKVAQRYRLTESGLVATTRSAGLMMQAGDFAGAAPWLAGLTDHPDHAVHQAMVAELQAICAGYLGDDAQYAIWRTALAEHDEAAAHRLDALIAAVKAHDATPVLTPLELLPDTSLPTAVDAALWSLDVSSFGRLLLDALRTSDNVSGAAAVNRPTIVPAARGNTLFINDGTNVQAIDNSSGAVLWRYPGVDSRWTQGQSDAARRNQLSAWLQQGVWEQQIVLLTGDRVVAVTGGNALAAGRGVGSGVGPNSMICLDAGLGRLQWELALIQIDPEWSSAEWLGRPVLYGDQVYALVRRIQRSGFADSHLIAVHVSSGRVKWKRHIASVPADARSQRHIWTDIVVADGTLYVTAQPGAVAQIATIDGSVRWLKALPAKLGPGRVWSGRPAQRSLTTGQIPMPWQHGALVHTASGLVVLDRAGEQLLVLDADSGRTVRTVDPDVWQQPETITSFDGDVLALGKKLIRLDGRTLTPRWSTVAVNSTVQQGQWSMTPLRLYLPDGDAVRVVRLSDGGTEPSLTIGRPVNVLVLQNQLVATDVGSIANYSTWGAAADRLTGLIASNPDDLYPRVSLVRLALNARRLDELMHYVDDAVAVAERPGADADARQLLFELVHDLATTSRGFDPTMRGALFDRLGRLCEQPKQAVLYRLAAAAFDVERGRPEQAMAHYQTILGAPAFRDQTYRDEGGARRVGLEVQRRLIALLGGAGSGDHHAFARLATRQLEALSSTAGVDELVGIAESFPGTDAAVEALIRAASIRARMSRTDQAFALLARARSQTTDPGQLARIAGQRAEIFDRSRRPGHAIAVLRRCAESQPPIRPLRDGQSVSAEAWVAELEPRIGLVHPDTRLTTARAEATPVDGHMLGVLAGDDKTGGRWLSQETRWLLMRDAATGDAAWRADVGNDKVELVRMTEEAIWLLRPDARQIECRDTRDGSRLWISDDLSDVLRTASSNDNPVLARAPVNPAQEFNIQMQPMPVRGRPVQAQQMVQAEGQLLIRDGVQRRVVMVDGQRVVVSGQPAQAALKVVAGPGAVAAVGSAGGLIVFDPWTGAIAWQAHSRFKVLRAVEVSAAHVAIAGVSEEGGEQLIVHDVHTGTVVHRAYPGQNNPVRWAALTGDGMLYYCTQMHAVVHDLVQSRVRWSLAHGRRLEGPHVWIGVDRMLVRLRGDRLVMRDLDDGSQITEVQNLPATRAVQDAADRWIVIGGQTCLALSGQGKLLWRLDSPSLKLPTDELPPHLLPGEVPTQFLGVAPSARHLLLLSGLETTGEPAPPASAARAGAWNLRLIALDRLDGNVAFQVVPNAKHVGSAIHAVSGAAIISAIHASGLVVAPPPD